MKPPFSSALNREFVKRRMALTSKLLSKECRVFQAYLYPSTATVLGQGILTNDLFHDFVVQERYRRFGIGSQLLRMILTNDETPNFVRLYAKASIHWKNVLLQKDLEKFYSKHGFVKTGVVTSKGVEMIYDHSIAALPPQQFNVESKLLVMAVVR